MKRSIIAIICTLCMSISGLSAKVILPSVLSDNMLLQQMCSVKLWGTTTNIGELSIHPSWSDESYTVTSDSQGRWIVEIPTPAASHSIHTITIYDGDTLILNNILVGEVWFCSGQSNMEMPMRGFDRQPVENSSDVIVKAKASTPIRIFNADSDNGVWIRQNSKVPQDDVIGRWYENDPITVASTSAVGYLFAKFIQEVLDVPVGIIVSSRGSANIESWMSRDAISKFKDIDLSILDNDTEVTTPMEARTPCVLYNAKIAPFTNFAIKGFLWYQGESNRHNAEQYKELTPAFVADLREKWGIDFPFYFVEIAPYNYEGADGNTAALLREAQLQNMFDIPNSSMVTTLDIGNPTSIHPEKKQEVGERLAHIALAECYGIDGGYDYATPYYESMEISGEKIYINVGGVRHGLSPMWSELDGFEIAGDDNIFYPAKGVIETSTCRLAVSCDKVKSPVAVRYAYKNYPSNISVYSTGGIPLAPFNTNKQ